jgi:Flp pilus assembly protein TadD
MENRLEALEAILKANPSDTLARYGLAMEYGRQGRSEQAVEQYRALIEANPDYSAAYFHGGQALERLGRMEEARELYRRGIEVTGRRGEQHAKDELEIALNLLG